MCSQIRKEKSLFSLSAEYNIFQLKIQDFYVLVAYFHINFSVNSVHPSVHNGAQQKSELP